VIVPNAHAAAPEGGRCRGVRSTSPARPRSRSHSRCSDYASFNRDTLKIVEYYEGHADLRQRALLLVPRVFAWPDVIVVTADPSVPTVTYSPRGLGRLRDAHPTTRHSPLADVLGRSRAALLSQLDLPMSTTQLACQLNLSAPTLDVHLRALQAAGIVSSRRTSAPCS
jgi:DNA-binding transcriptional ArsR family regulator